MKKRINKSKPCVYCSYYLGAGCFGVALRDALIRKSIRHDISYAGMCLKSGYFTTVNDTCGNFTKGDIILTNDEIRATIKNVSAKNNTLNIT